MTNYKEILRLHSLGINNTRVAESCGCARSTVISTVQRAQEKGITWEDIRSLGEADVARKLYPATSMGRQYKIPDCEYVHQEMQKSGVTLSLLWVEYCEQCRANGELPYQSTQFNKYYADFVHKTKATMRLEHKPGETMQVDWAGQTAHIVDTDTGEQLDAYLFVAVLPYSGYAYTEAFLDMKQDAWITAHVNAYRFFGGVTRILTPDNLKTGVTKNTRYDTMIPRAYKEMADHYNTAIVPARVKHPDDKPNAEGSVKFATTWILAALRNYHFFSIEEARVAVSEKLEELNLRPFKKRLGNRRSAFMNEEREFMQPLPKAPYESAVWSTAKVQNDYLISDGINKYSVPFDLIGEQVDIRLTSTIVEVFYHGGRVASHVRKGNPQRDPICIREHMPLNHQKYLSYNPDEFVNWAENIGTFTLKTIQHFLYSEKEPEQGYKYCIGLMKAAEKYGNNRIEKACEKLLTVTTQPSLRSIITILKNRQDKLGIDTKETKPQNANGKRSNGITRGLSAYRNGGDAE